MLTKSGQEPTPFQSFTLDRTTGRWKARSYIHIRTSIPSMVKAD